MNRKQVVVLVVDDDERNLRLLEALLIPHGYQVMLAKDGKEALSSVAEVPPDVILLDVMMPEMDGFTVCRRLKKSKETAPIPVILITGLGDRESRLHGMECGANDFLTKPVDPDELVLRVRNAASHKSLYNELEESHRKLVQLEQLKDDLIHMVAHDMKSPLSVIMVALDLVEFIAPGRLITEQHRYLQDAKSAADRILGMVQTFLDMSRLETGDMPLHLEKLNIASVINEALGRMQVLVVQDRIRWNSVQERIECWCDREVIIRVVTNLLGNALNFSPNQTTIELELKKREDCAYVSVSDQGPGIPSEYQTKIFEKFTRVKANRENVNYRSGSGVGLAFCRLAVEAHKGRIGVKSEDEKGSVFWFELPIARSENKTAPNRGLGDGQDSCR